MRVSLKQVLQEISKLQRPRSGMKAQLRFTFWLIKRSEFGQIGKKPHNDGKRKGLIAIQNIL